MAKIKPILFISLFLLNLISFGQGAPMGNTFSTTASATCWGTSSSANECVTFPIVVSGVGNLSYWLIKNSWNTDWGEVF